MVHPTSRTYAWPSSACTKSPLSHIRGIQLQRHDPVPNDFVEVGKLVKASHSFSIYIQFPRSVSYTSLELNIECSFGRAGKCMLHCVPKSFPLFKVRLITKVQLGRFCLILFVSKVLLSSLVLISVPQ